MSLPVSPVALLIAILFACGVVRTLTLATAFRYKPNMVVATRPLESIAQQATVEAACGYAQWLLYRGYGSELLSCRSGAVWLTWPKTNHPDLSTQGDDVGIVVLCPPGALVSVTRTLVGFRQFRFEMAPQDFVIWVRPHVGRQMVEILGLVDR